LGGFAVMHVTDDWFAILASCEPLVRWAAKESALGALFSHFSQKGGDSDLYALRFRHGVICRYFSGSFLAFYRLAGSWESFATGQGAYPKIQAMFGAHDVQI
jgi:hypothetical protein